MSGTSIVALEALGAAIDRRDSIAVQITKFTLASVQVPAIAGVYERI